MVFTLTELALVGLDSLLRAANLLRAAFQANKNSLSAEHTPDFNRVISELVFMLDVVGRYTSQDVMRYRTYWNVRI
jgi:hypothetical protein